MVTTTSTHTSLGLSTTVIETVTAWADVSTLSLVTTMETATMGATMVSVCVYTLLPVIKGVGLPCSQFNTLMLPLYR